MPTQLPNVFIRKGISFDGLNFHLSCPLKRPKTWIEARECDAFIRHRLQKAAVSPVPTKRGEFQKRVFFEVVVMSVFRAF